MFENIGRKIKTLAKVMFVIGAIVSFFAAMALMIEERVGTGFVLMIAGPLVALISSWPLFGLGELIETAKDIERNTRGGERKSMAQSILDSERINKIEKLRSQGLITEEEYQAAISKGE